MKNKKILQIVSFMLCLVLAPSIPVFAETGESETWDYVCSDTDQLQYVEDIDEYLAQLNAGLITPDATTIITYESTIEPCLVLEPSKKCSNILGHKWDEWENWSETQRIHKESGPCISVIERWHYCTRTYCGASQKEITSLYIENCAH